MATQKGSTHVVGNLNSFHVVTIPNVFAGADLENYSLVKLAYVGGKRTATYATVAGDDAFLLAAVEVMYDDELVKEFYVGNGEGGRVVHLEKGVRFETSGYVQISGTAPAKGQYASWDGAAKKFQLAAAKPATPVGGKIFEVVAVDGAGDSYGIPMVRLEVL